MVILLSTLLKLKNMKNKLKKAFVVKWSWVWGYLSYARSTQGQQCYKMLGMRRTVNTLK